MERFALRANAVPPRNKEPQITTRFIAAGGLLVDSWGRYSKRYESLELLTVTSCDQDGDRSTVRTCDLFLIFPQAPAAMHTHNDNLM